jgi:hypothetical protein
VAELQQALFLQSLPDDLPAGITRIYAGAEFCPWRLPDLAALRRMLVWARERRCAFTLATPVLIEPQRAAVEHLLAALLPAFRPEDELLISDWGTLELARALRKDLCVVLGRTLSGQKRDPRTAALGFDPTQLAHFRSCSWHAAPAVELLVELGITRVELDNLQHGLAPLPPPLRGALHTPYAMVAASRNCPFRPHGHATPCPQPCGEAFSLRHADLPEPLVQGGNTQFLRTGKIPDDLLGYGIDRVVEHLALPR